MNHSKQQGHVTGLADTATERLCEQVRLHRQARGWTLEQLAEKSRVSRSMLSQIERKQVNPTFHMAYRIAQAFGMSLGELVDDTEDLPVIEVIRESSPKYSFGENQSHVRSLHPMYLDKDVEFYEVQLKPGALLDSAPHIRGTREFLTVQKGTLRISVTLESKTLSEGDSARYYADVPHSIENVGHEDALAFLVAVYRQQRMV